MNNKKLLHIISKGENEQVEFKTSFNKQTIESVVAFSNTSGGRIIVGVNDKIEFYNPGKLYGDITIENLLTDNYSSQTRNKLIAKAFKEIGLIEKYGSGIKRILNICKESGVIPPNFEEVFNGFRVTLFKEKLNVPDNVHNNVLDNRLSKIIELIKNNNKISLQEITNQLNVSKRTMRRDIEKLKQQNKIKRIGSEKTGHWEIIS